MCLRISLCTQTMTALQGMFAAIRRIMVRVAERNGLKARALTYWGLPLIPLLLLRKMMSLAQGNVTAGFDSRVPDINTARSLLARCEPLPQPFVGTSVMAVVENQT